MLGVNNLLGFGSRPPSGGAAFRYFRQTVTANGGVNDIDIAQLQLMVGAVAHPTTAMTSNSAPSPLVATANGELNASFAVWHAFDQDITTSQWNSGLTGADWWIQIDFGSGNDITPDAVKVTSGGNGATLRPVDFRIDGSATGSFSGEETLLLTVTTAGFTSNFETLTFNF